VTVVLVRWPVEAMRRAQLADRQVPRLLLIEEETAPPQADDCLEDWIRMPASDIDVGARLSGLAGRTDRQTDSGAGRPVRGGGEP
jgi:hypothetical protein